MQREILRGYGAVFRRDWRLYSIPDGKGGRKPLPFPSGLPMRTIGYFLATFAAIVVLTRLPGLGLLVRLLPWPIVYIGIPALVASGLTQLEPDGRPAVRWIATLLEHRLTPSTTSAGRPIRREREVAILEPVTAIAADTSSPDLGRCRIHGPATITFTNPVVVTQRKSGRHTARPTSTKDTAADRSSLATDVELDPGERLDINA